MYKCPLFHGPFLAMADHQNCCVVTFNHIILYYTYVIFQKSAIKVYYSNRNINMMIHLGYLKVPIKLQYHWTTR